MELAGKGRENSCQSAEGRREAGPRYRKRNVVDVKRDPDGGKSGRVRHDDGPEDQHELVGGEGRPKANALGRALPSIKTLGAAYRDMESLSSASGNPASRAASHNAGHGTFSKHFDMSDSTQKVAKPRGRIVAACTPSRQTTSHGLAPGLVLSQAARP